MTKATRARYTLEFRQEAVRLVEGGQSQATVAKTLGLVEQTLFNWVKASRQGRLKGVDSTNLRVRSCFATSPPTGYVWRSQIHLSRWSLCRPATWLCFFQLLFELIDELGQRLPAGMAEFPQLQQVHPT
jgi:hypothetical protein